MIRPICPIEGEDAASLSMKTRASAIFTTMISTKANGTIVQNAGTFLVMRNLSGCPRPKSIPLTIESECSVLVLISHGKGALKTVKSGSKNRVRKMG